MKIPPSKTVIIIAGPTAVGKTAVAIEIAKHFNAEIISADSRQCFKEMNIGVARPSPHELQQVPHHFIASQSIQDEVTAIVFEQYALKKTIELFQNHDTIVMVGGTGLYIKAFCEGLDNIPEVPPQVRNRINSKYEEEGLQWLQNEIKIKDPEFYKAGEIQNPRRIMRALEVVEATGESILHFRRGEKTVRDFTIKKIGLELTREELNRRIDKRIDEMLAKGLVNEVKDLLPYKHLNALQTVGYAELFDFLENKTTLGKAEEAIKIHTRQYAKRQLTWFKKDNAFKWVSPFDISAILQFLKENG